MPFSCIIILLVFPAIVRPDACSQPLGIESGVIPDSSITSTGTGSTSASVRLNNAVSCLSISSVQIDLGRIMTITGFAFISDVQSEATVRYGIDSSNLNNDYNRLMVREVLWNYSRGNRKFQINSSNTMLTFKNSTFTLRYIKFNFSPAACLKLEIYGCAEICSSSLHPTDKIESTNTLVTAQYKQAVTMSGLIFLSKEKLVNVTVKCFRNSQLQNSSLIQIPAMDSKNVTIWLQNNLICDKIELSLSYSIHASNIFFLGCESECMQKLDIKDSVLSASSIYDPVKDSYLNNLRSAWSAKLESFTKQWIQACFTTPVVVFAVALQAQGYYGFKKIKSFHFSYAYESGGIQLVYEESDRVIRFQGPDSRYGTKVRHLNFPVTAKCFRLGDLECIRPLCTARWELLGCKEGLRPRISIPDKVITRASTSIKLLCNIYGQPGTTYQWEITNKKIANDTFHRVTVEVKKTKGLDISYSLQLEIFTNKLAEFIQNNNNNDVNCSIHGNNQNIDCWLTYTCKAYYWTSHEVDRKTVLWLNGAVGKPNVSHVQVTNTTVRVNWSPSISNGDFPVTSYVISLTDDGNDGSQIFQTKKTQQNQLFQHLQPFRNYTISIFALNSFNISSATVKIAFTTNQSAPSAVTDLKLEKVFTNGAILAWGRPQTTNGILSSYFVDYRANNELIQRKTSNLSITIEGLEAYTNYSINVRGSTKKGKLLGPWVTIAIKTNQGKPEAPSNIRASFVENAILRIEWTKPRKINGILKKYKIVVHGLKDYYPSFQYENINITAQNHYLVYNAYPGTNYTIHVRAETGWGEGDNGTTTFETAYAKPNKANVTNSTILTSGQQQIHLNPMKPFTGPIRFYELAVSNSTQSDCFLKAIFNDTLLFESLQSMETITIEKGKRDVKFRTKSFSLGLIGSFRFCFRAVINNEKI